MYENAKVYLSDQRTEGTFRLSSVAREFEAQLTERTKVPAHKLEAYPKKTDVQILDEAEAVEEILKRFSQAVMASMDNPGYASDFLAELDLRSISRDHNWRRIFATIAAQEDSFEGHKRVALVKYSQYLNTRRKLLEYVRAQKGGLEETDAHEITDIRRARQPLVDIGQEDASAATGFIRLPMGEAVEIELPQTGPAEMMFARHLYRLAGRSQPCLVDQNGVTHFLKQGRNMVGRHPESDIVIDPNFHDISRAHVVLEWDGVVSVWVTDLSTRGTYLPTAATDCAAQEDITLQ